MRVDEDSMSNEQAITAPPSDAIRREAPSLFNLTPSAATLSPVPKADGRGRINTINQQTIFGFNNKPFTFL